MSELMKAIDASPTAPHVALIGALLMLALLSSRSLGMSIGVLVMFFGAWVHDGLFVMIGIVWAYAMTPDKPEEAAVVDGNVTPEEGRSMARTVLVLATLAAAMLVIGSIAAGVVLWRLTVRLLR